MPPLVVTNTKIAKISVRSATFDPISVLNPNAASPWIAASTAINVSGKIEINGDVVATTDNDIVLCEAGDIHEFINISDTEPLIFLVIRTNDPGNEDMIWEEV